MCGFTSPSEFPQLKRLALPGKSKKKNPKCHFPTGIVLLGLIWIDPKIYFGPSHNL